MRPRSGACEWVMVYTVRCMRACTRLYVLVYGMVVRLEWYVEGICSAMYAWYTVIYSGIWIYMRIEGW